MAFLKKYSNLLLVFVSILLYFFIGYFLVRTNFSQLVFLWFSIFTCAYFLWKNNQDNFSFLAGISLLFRLVFLFSIPNLSQDFYRFIWDGRMIFEGFNPYLSLPETFIEQRNYPVNQAVELYNGMGEMNGSHYTNYPPINQLCFLIAALFANKSILGSVVVMRTLIILADIGILYFGKKLLEKLQLPVQNIFLYILNPFVIIELTGNLHFEPVMLFFLVWSLYLLHQRKWIFAAILLACSVSVKLIPLLFLPLFFQWFVKRDKKLFLKVFLQLTSFYIIVLSTVILLFLPFFSSTLIDNYSNSVGLWFRNFEFNASFYYLAREIGYLFRGYNEIAVIGKVMPVLTIIFLLILTFFRKNILFKNLITAMLFGLSFYYFTTTTMHPWYIATLLILAVFTKYRFPVIWSVVIILSYQAYANTPWKENLWFVALEYLIVYCFLGYELLQPKKD
ncbi:mannosyltransferase [Tenacibaculum holothuriorum]|uniref:Mannosyltransferase n=1 Tax=Tenacibaculum holothuriorum TaxID=1635173 RepID=A0A1Y2PAF8_9FLAO|nr:mannosyltransferase [Tenacibaculum holothuriorum]OSY87150.1 mannosyltransferase [Tenacibaculum holothuriorum]